MSSSAIRDDEENAEENGKLEVTDSNVAKPRESIPCIPQKKQVSWKQQEQFTAKDSDYYNKTKITKAKVHCMLTIVMPFNVLTIAMAFNVQVYWVVSISSNME